MTEVLIGCDYIASDDNKTRVYVKAVEDDRVTYSYYRDDAPDMLSPNEWGEGTDAFLKFFRFYQEG